MNVEQLGLQLGLAGLIVTAAYRVAIFFIERWSLIETERTKAMASGFTQLTAGFTQLVGQLSAHSSADLTSHAEIRDRVSRFEGQLGEILSSRERTPVSDPPSERRPKLRTPAHGLRPPKPGEHDD